MGHPVDIAEAVAQDADRFGLVLAAGEHAREIGNSILKWQAPPVGTRCAAALREITLDGDLRREAWQRLIERQRHTGEIDIPSETDRVDEESLITRLSRAIEGGDMAA